jgi:hypothetical protein
MIMIAKRFKTYVSLGNLGLSLGEVHYSPRNIHVPREKDLNFLKEQFKPFFPWGTIMSQGKKNLSCPMEQMCMKFCLIIIFAYEFKLKCSQQNVLEMAMIAKKFGTHLSPRNCSPRKVPFLPRNLGLSPRKIHYSLKKLYISPKNFSYSTRYLLVTKT